MHENTKIFINTKKNYMNKNQTKQKFTNNLKIVSTFLILSFGVTNSYAIKLTLNGQPAASDPVVLNLTESVVYDYGQNFRPIVTNTDNPYLCIGPNLGLGTSPNVSFSISSTDPFRVYGLVDVASATYDYNPVLLADKIFNVQTYANSQCVVKGFNKVDNPNPGNPLLFEDSFESGGSGIILTYPDLSISILEENSNTPLPNNDTLSHNFDYTYRYELLNIGDEPITIDIVDYFSLTSNNTSWVCNESSGAAAATTCGPDAIKTVGENYTGAVYLKDAHIENTGESLIITVTRNPNIVADNTNIDLLVSALVTSDVDAYGLNNSDTRVLIGNTNAAPTISTVGNQVILEDAVLGTGDLSFTVGDAETIASNLVTSATSSNQSIVADANITLSGSGANRTVSVIANADANTATSGSVTITLQVTDSNGGSTTSNFNLDITPVNDKPTFTVATIADFPAGTLGNQFITNFITGVTYGPTSDENNQSIINQSISNVVDPNGVLNSTPLLGTDLLLELTGQGGTASFDIQLQDDGSTSNAGMNTSDPVTVTFTVLNTLPSISMVADTSINEDNSTSALAFTISDAETAAGSLTMTAMSSDISIVPISGIVFAGTGGNRTVQITPTTNQNTSSGTPVTITLVVDDGSDTSQTTFDLTVDPVNDAPTFSLDPNITNTFAQSNSLIEVLNFATALSMGPTGDEDFNQSVLNYNIQVTDASSIFDQSIVSVDINNNGTLKYVLTGNLGTATIDVSLQDDGGVANGGVDTSAVQSFTITVQ